MTANEHAVEGQASADSLEPPKDDGRSARARAQREERREQILGAARRLFAEKGYHATSISDVIEAAEIARGTFYLYFESKRSIFDEIVNELIGRLRGCLKRIDTAAGAPPVMEQLRGNVQRVLEVLLHNRDLSNILRRTAIGIDAEFDNKLAAFYGALAALIERTLNEGMEMGLLRPIDPRVGSLCILGSIKELTTQLLSEETTPPAMDPLIDELLRYHLEGLLKR